VAVTDKTREADEKLREELRNADIGKLREMMAPLIEKLGIKPVKSQRTPRTQKSRMARAKNK
jgi:hypothetical protein